MMVADLVLAHGGGCWACGIMTKPVPTAQLARRPTPRSAAFATSLMGLDQSGGFVRLVFESPAGEH